MEIHGGDELERFEGSDGRVRHVSPRAARTLDCDIVIVGAGVMPDVMLARSAGLELGEAGGVQCSAGLESSVPGRVRRRRHLRVRQPGARPADAHRALGRGLQPGQDRGAQHARPRRGARRDPVLLLRPRGLDARWSTWGRARATWWCAARWTTASSRPSTSTRAASVAALSVGRSDDLEHARRFISEGATPDAGALGDESTDLSSL